MFHLPNTQPVLSLSKVKQMYCIIAPFLLTIYLPLFSWCVNKSKEACEESEVEGRSYEQTK